MNQKASTTSPGKLDPTFAKEGVLRFPIAEVSVYPPAAVIALADDKLLVAIRYFRADGFTVIRLKSNGEVDVGAGYGDREQGFVEIDIPLEPDHLVVSVVGGTQLSDGGVLITSQYGGANGGLVIVRLMSDGRINENFGEAGFVFLRVFPEDSPEQLREKIKPDFAQMQQGIDNNLGARMSGGSGVSSIEQPDGKLIIVNSGADLSEGRYKGKVVRLNSDGSFDKTFNGTGAALVELEVAGNNYAFGVAAQQDGKLLVMGEYHDGIMGNYVVRFNQDGTRDQNFSTFMLSSSIGLNFINDIVVRKNDDLIVLAGHRYISHLNGMSLLIVLNRDGDYNLVFNQGKPMYSQLSGAGGELWNRCCFAGEGDSKLILAGTSGSGALVEDTFAITARYLMTGEVDETFNSQGWVAFNQIDDLEVTRDMTLMADGRIVVCGELYKDKTQLEPYGGWVIRYSI